MKDQSTWSPAELLRAAAYFLHTGSEQVKVKYMDGPHEEPVGVRAPVELTAEHISRRLGGQKSHESTALYDVDIPTRIPGGYAIV